MDLGQSLHRLQGGQSTLSRQRIHAGVILHTPNDTEDPVTTSCEVKDPLGLSAATDLHEELHGAAGVVLCAVVVLLQDVEQAELLAVVAFQQLLTLLHLHGPVHEAEEGLVRLALLQLLQRAADQVRQIHLLARAQEELWVS